jgi:hypothetical protein
MGNVALPSNVVSGFIIGAVESDSPGSVKVARRKTSFPRWRTDCDPAKAPPSLPAPAPDPPPEPLEASTPASTPGAPDPLPVPEDPLLDPPSGPSDPLPDSIVAPPSPRDSVLAAPPDEEPHRTDHRASVASASMETRDRLLMGGESREGGGSAQVSDRANFCGEGELDGSPA